MALSLGRKSQIALIFLANSGEILRFINGFIKVSYIDLAQSESHQYNTISYYFEHLLWKIPFLGFISALRKTPKIQIASL